MKHTRRVGSELGATVLRPQWVALVAAISTLLSAAALSDLHRSIQISAAEELSMEALRAQNVSQRQYVSPLPPAPSSDLSAGLPPRPDVSALLNELRRSAAESGIVLDSIQVLERPLDPAQLSRTDLSVRLRGTYPSLKSVLRDVTDRLPAVTISHVRFRRVAPGLAEASVLFGTWSSAATAGAVVK